MSNDLSVILTLATTATNLSDVAHFVAASNSYYAKPTTTLLESDQLSVDGFDVVPSSIPETLQELSAALDTLLGLGVALDTELQSPIELALDLEVRSLEPISCGECNQNDVLLTLHVCPVTAAGSI